MASVVRSVFKSIREKGLSNFIRELKEEGYTKCIFDGNLLQTKIHNIGARLVGVDKFGNKYYENLELQCDDGKHGENGLPWGTAMAYRDDTGIRKLCADIFVSALQGGGCRHRWVEYGSKERYNASQVPAEWHGWLHYVTDHTGDELLMLKPKRYGIEHKQNFSGEGDEYIYHSKGHALNPGQRNWTRYQPWQPTKS